MIDILVAAYLGFIQGITEFFPVSSSGHLVLSQLLLKRFGLDSIGDPLFFDVLLHLGTLLVVIGFYRNELLQFVYEWTGVGTSRDTSIPNGVCRMWTWCVAAATVTTLVFYIPLRTPIQSAFDKPLAVGLALLFTGTILLISRKVSGNRTAGGEKNLNLATAVLIGLGQTVAIFPGVSRSGTTIALALILGMRREEAVTFSFLLSLPAILGGALISAYSVESVSLAEPLVGMAVAALFGWFALSWLVRLVIRGRLVGFSVYCYALGAVTVLLALVSR
jgi:undecaprenyl-diphosphatase